MIQTNNTGASFSNNKKGAWKPGLRSDCDLFPLTYGHGPRDVVLECYCSRGVTLRVSELGRLPTLPKLAC